VKIVKSWAARFPGLSGRSSVAWSLGIAAVLITIKVVCEHQTWVGGLERHAYELMQKRLVAGGTSNRPEVLVIDIGKIKAQSRTVAGQVVTVIPREPIEKLITTLVNNGAQSVGVDIDFSPVGGEFVDPGDPGFFARCLHLSEEHDDVPICLGVLRTQEQPYRWLGDDRYMRLAATIATSGVAHGEAIHWTRHKNGPPLPSMSAALAGADVYEGINEKTVWSWAVESTSVIETKTDVHSAVSAIDFSPLQRIKEDKLPALDPAAFEEMKDKIENRIVLLGDTSPPPSDFFSVPGVSGKVAGVYLLACGANTIASDPLYYLTTLGRIAMDSLLAILVLLLVKGSLWALGFFRLASVRAEEWLGVVFTLGAIVLTTIISVYTVRLTRLLWTDFILVCLVMFFQLVIDTIKWRMHFISENSEKPKRQRKITDE
jgi:CHASE2 domain-containing sensor protein